MNAIRKEIDLAAPIDRVWRAVTDHEEFGSWFRVRLDGPFRVGETATGAMTYPGYEHLTWQATVERMEPYVFAFSWHPYAIDPTVDYADETPTLVTFMLRPSTVGTHLTIAESGFDALPPHRFDEALRMNDRGWTIQAANIAAHVA
ncbi:SRPBCC family protein [Aurantimonas sp. MSK8Z-1]|uniref:SRPBCC family protein n=1 Tax=Mangrovibrevibacter kandeliae TaxID=2968473 RepID=UPI002117D1EF|nr:SRPBCC family protein [Aurantimonas sp. MSK8Z-1]MCW4116214.1 SRPBCC family protein [Aurantimonas sp. MSK8Z-1]